MTSPLDDIEPERRAVVDEEIAQRSRERDHLVIYLSGAHAYGFPSPDSDFDLKCVHVAPTRDLVGLAPRDGGAERLAVVDGVEIDYGSNEVGPVLRGALRGNGNYLERLLGSSVLAQDAPAIEGLRPLVQSTLSRLVFRHYAGFANSQLGAALANEPPAAKKVLYVLRTTLTGTHLLQTGEVVADLALLATPLGFDGAHELIALKRAGERVPLDPGVWARWRQELDRAFQVLEGARSDSPLPEEPPGNAARALEEWLVELRRQRFDR
jgi:predicted nucleotidyltransferase